MTDTPHITEPVQEIARQSKRRASGAIIGGIVVCLVLVITVVSIGVQRYEYCVDQNHRHDQSLAYILDLAHGQEAKASPALKRQIQQQIGEYRILFQDLLPKRSCSLFS